jgi:hypothetical protein
MTTEGAQRPAPSVSALLTCGSDDVPRIAETLLSLAAQSVPAFDVQIIVVGGSEQEVGGLAELVGSFDEGFSSRVEVTPMGPAVSETPFAFGVGRSRAAYVATLFPDDVVFAHWAETLVAHVPAARGRAIASLVAVQPAEEASWGGGRILTTVERPQVPSAGGFDLLELLASPPSAPRGLALPRRAVQRVLGLGLPPAAEAWAVHVAVAITCGVLETGEVTHLSRSLPSVGGTSVDGGERERTSRVALEVLDRCGLTLGPGALGSLSGSPRPSTVQRLEEELEVVREELRRADEAGRAHAAAESAALERVTGLLSSWSWRASAPLRLLGGVARRLGWSPRRSPDP